MIQSAHPKKITLALIGVLQASSMLHADDNCLDVTGTAQHTDTGTIAYSEFHNICHDTHSVRYETASGSVIADKRIEYSHGSTTPLFQMQDHRFQRTTGNEWRDNHFIIYRQEKNRQRHEKKQPPSASLIIDAGFDHFIRTHWNDLVAGQSLPFDFIVSDPLITLHMTLEHVTPADSAITSHDSNTLFLARSRNRLISWAIPEIHLAYDSDTRLLQVYHGPSNLTDDKDRSQTVTIHYSYLTTPMETAQHE